MKRFSALTKKIFLLCLISTVVVACKKEVEPTDNVTVTSTEETVQEGSNKGLGYTKGSSATPNCLEVALESPDHTTLVKAVQAAGVENSLVNVGPLTVFAPTNAAFDKLDKATLDDLMKPENKSKLSSILLNHVAPSNYPIENLKQISEQGNQLYMASGEYVDVKVEGDDIFVDGKKILGTVRADNGWVHVIDEVILPKSN